MQCSRSLGLAQLTHGATEGNHCACAEKLIDCESFQCGDDCPQLLLRPSAPRTAQTTGCQPDSREGYTGDSAGHIRSEQTERALSVCGRQRSRCRIPETPKHCKMTDASAQKPQTDADSMSAGGGRCEARSAASNHAASAAAVSVRLSSSVTESELCPS